jgi:hypothetical protein
MITPSFSITATERVLPKLALNFTTASLDPRITFTRSGDTATVTNSSGVIVGINADLPRFDYNPTTLACNGLLVEEARTNLLLNSLLNGTNLATQIVVTTAVANTLSFYGTGQIVLTGTSSTTVVGTGAYPTRTTLTFTPTVGALTLTVTGTVQYAQLETGAFASSFIPTAASQVTRTADVAVMTGTNFSDWFNATQGTLVIQATPSASLFTAPGRTPADINNGTDDTSINFRFRPTGKTGFVVNNAASVQVNTSSTASYSQSICKLSGAYKENDSASSFNAESPVVDTVCTIPSGFNQVRFGASFTGISPFSGTLQQFMYFPQRLTDNEVQAFSKG